MVLQINRTTKYFWLKQCGTLLIAAAFITLVLSGRSQAETGKQQTFASPEEAVTALVAALKTGDTKTLSAIFGPESKDILSSGDPVADKAEHEQFIKRYEQKNRLEEETTGKMTLSIGDEDWPFAIPIVKEAGAWRFDTGAGREEILARRIGRNELDVIQVCLAFVDAQREYARNDRNGDGFREYAQKFRSDSGKQDGLYWEAKEGDEQSPFGPLLAAAQEEGYPGRPAGSEPVPYHGYYYRILKAQGKNAPGGAYDYIINGKMIGGFAVVAHPADYANSGIMTFIVNHDAVVYQKDLGENTEELVKAMTLFDPDETWTPAQ
jgi:hypothetical protein